VRGCVGASRACKTVQTHERGLTVRDLERVRSCDAAAAEGARGEAIDAGLEVGDGGRAAVLVPAKTWAERWGRRT